MTRYGVTNHNVSTNILSVVGIYTGSVYCDHSLVMKGFRGECRVDTSVSVIKIHEIGSSLLKLFAKAIIIIRDPADAIVAEYNRRKVGHTRRLSPSKLDGKIWMTIQVSVLYSQGRCFDANSVVTGVMTTHSLKTDDKVGIKTTLCFQYKRHHCARRYPCT